MASITANGSKGHHKFTLNVTQSATDIATNTSTLTFDFKISPIYNSWDFYGWNQQIAYTITINGTNYTGYIPDYDGYSVVTLKTGTQSVKHNDDGSKSISYSFSVTDSSGQAYTPGTASASGTFTLTTIPRASTISSVDGRFIGGETTVTIARATDAFTHQLWYKVGNSEWYDLGKGIGTSKTFTIDIATANQFPNAVRGTMQLCVRTFNGTTTIGNDFYYDVIVNLPDSIKPTISNIKLTGNNLLSGAYVQGKSTVTAEITAASLYGATIKSYSATVDGKTYSGNKFTSSVLSTGSKSVSVTVTDTRGRTATLSSSAFTVYAYANPTITEFTLARQSDETTVIATVKGSIAAVNNKNAKTIQVTLNGVTQTITSSAYSINGTTTFTNVPTDNTLTAIAKITDSYTHATREFVLPTVAVTMDFHSSGKGVAFGKVSESSNLLDIAWNMKVGGNITDQFGTLIHNGLAVYGGGGDTGLDPNTTLEELILTSHKNAPQGTGTFFFVHTRFYNTKSTSAARVQIAYSYNKAGYLYHRYYASGGWSAWERFLREDELSDYVVEQGTNGSWTYEKWNSGVIKCYCAHSVSNIAVTSAWGAMYSSPQITLPTFPTAFGFKATPQVNLSWNGEYSAIIDGATGVSTTKCGYTYLFRPDSATLSSGKIAIQVIGRWK